MRGDEQKRRTGRAVYFDGLVGHDHKHHWRRCGLLTACSIPETALHWPPWDKTLGAREYNETNQRLDRTDPVLSRHVDILLLLVLWNIGDEQLVSTYGNG